MRRETKKTVILQSKVTLVFSFVHSQIQFRLK